MPVDPAVDRSLVGRGPVDRGPVDRGPNEAQGDDWLDAYCWRCGSADAVPHADGRLLCTPCRHAEIELPVPVLGGFRFTGRIEWESHALERCWRCMTAPVDPQDDLGLCQDCRSIGDNPAA